MDCTKVLSLLERLDDEIDDLKDSMAPLLVTTLSKTASKLPVLDRAKLYILTTYTIESILFSYLRLNGVNAREHPVFVELTRVKQYFEKIKQVETPPAERNMTIDKGAVGRLIKNGLAGNDKFDLQKAEQMAKERAKANVRLNEIKNNEGKRQIENAGSIEQLNFKKEFPSDSISFTVQSATNKPEQHDSTKKNPTYSNKIGDPAILTQASPAEREKKRSKGLNENENTRSKKRSRKRKSKKQKTSN